MDDHSNIKNRLISPEPMSKTGDEPGTYVYEPAGIRERSGYVPAWLQLIALGLILWGVYYTIRYWSSY